MLIWRSFGVYKTLTALPPQKPNQNNKDEVLKKAMKWIYN